MLTVKNVIDAVHAVGLTCRYSSEYLEFRINYKVDDDRWTEDSAYYTTYRDDAIATAQIMAGYRTEEK